MDTENTVTVDANKIKEERVRDAKWRWEGV